MVEPLWVGWDRGLGASLDRDVPSSGWGLMGWVEGYVMRERTDVALKGA
ncbi:MAG: hypothetical protein QXL64_07765 [Thermofilaceae archaeon]